MLEGAQFACWLRLDWAEKLAVETGSNFMANPPRWRMRHLGPWPEGSQQHMPHGPKRKSLNDLAKAHFFFPAWLSDCAMDKVRRPSCKSEGTASSPRLAYPFLGMTGMDFVPQEVQKVDLGQQP